MRLEVALSHAMAHTHDTLPVPNLCQMLIFQVPAGFFDKPFWHSQILPFLD
jgi:hypothetical protein